MTRLATTTLSLIGALVLAAAPPAFAQAAKAPPTALSYGSDAAQQLDFWRATGKTPAPLVLFVHGGGWKRGDKDSATGRYKVEHYTGEGYAFASVNYRLVPAATVEQQAQDVADALAALLKRADALGIARGKVVLMGHSAGAHLVALVGTDPRYLQKAGLSYADVRGVIPIDGAAYDIPSQMADAGRMMAKTYQQAFGTDPARQRALSPTAQAAAPNAPAFLLLHVQRDDGVRQAEDLEAALRKAGTPVERQGFPGRGLPGHMQINREMGNPDYAATGVVDRWLARAFS
ncbi:alpha/beta hydrolase [Novosphingobium resinovorum]|uniref:alpha/beta hydrolase n=1 Tax=Novosphingobium resinovorum TaxID=158500 RepID=UPI002ED4F7C3|nr:alpha/beta hydrolase [Novosphingobium resinovorum]